jgi:NAD(P)H dehydrogenase (quinone)
MSKKKILVVLGHPDARSLCGALVKDYVAGARAGGAVVKQLTLSRMKFDPILHQGYKVVQSLEPDLLRAQKLIMWADHLVFAYPMWWGSMPALLKGFFDRAFHPGFAFKFATKDAYLWDKLLTGRSARVMITCDGPPLAIRLLYSNPAVQAIKGMTLEFCGIAPVRVSLYGGVKHATAARMHLWHRKAEEDGQRDALQ